MRVGVVGVAGGAALSERAWTISVGQVMRSSGAGVNVV